MNCGNLDIDGGDMLLDKLKEKQGDLSDYKFAEKLGIAHQLWQMIRTGKRNIPKPVLLQGIARAHPELAPDVLIFLGFDVVMSSLLAELLTNPHQTSQDSKLGGFKAWWSGVVLRARKIWHNSHEP